MDQMRFLYGTLCHLPLLRLVMGCEPAACPAELPGHRVAWDSEQDFPVILPDPQTAAPGLLVSNVTPEAGGRLDYYAASLGLAPVEKGVRLDSTVVLALTYMAEPARWQQARAWNLAEWVTRQGELALATAADIMDLHGRVAAAEVLARRGPMRVRAASRLRAEGEPARATLRRAPGAADVEIADRRTAYANFFAVEEYDLRHRRFDGGMSETMSRAVFVSGDAATVLPWDPIRDRVLLIEQFRAGPLARGDRNPWSPEAIAGRIDPGETPEQAARREAVEEAGLSLGRMWYVGGFYTSPGAKSEFILSYVAECDLPDSAARTGGVAEEHEDIRGHVIPFARLMELVASGEANNAPLLITAMWLDRHRTRSG